MVIYNHSQRFCICIFNSARLFIPVLRKNRKIAWIYKPVGTGGMFHFSSHSKRNFCSCCPPASHVNFLCCWCRGAKRLKRILNFICMFKSSKYTTCEQNIALFLVLFFLLYIILLHFTLYNSFPIAT